jgi:hypothetical protein
MATIATNSHGNFNNVPRRSYIAMSSYTSDFFGYSLVFNPVTFSNVGTLSTLGVPATSTLRGSILSETGKKLYPSANAGVSTLMVSVFDHTSLLTGFINPNSPSFAIFNTDKPPYMGQGVDPGTNLSTNLGNSIYTHGSVVADGYGTYSGLLSTGQSLTVGTTAQIGASLSTGTSATIGTSLSVGTSISSGTSITAGSYIAGRALTVLTYNTGFGGVTYNNVGNNCDVFTNPSAGNLTLINLSSGYTNLRTVNFYVNNTTNGGAAYGPPAGEAFTTMMINSSGSALSTFLSGTNIKGNNFGFPNNTRALLSFVGDGTLAYETSGIIIPA